MAATPPPAILRADERYLIKIGLPPDAARAISQAVQLVQQQASTISDLQQRLAKLEGDTLGGS